MTFNPRLGRLFNVCFQNGDSDGSDGSPGSAASVGGGQSVGVTGAPAGYGNVGAADAPAGTSAVAPGTGYGTGVATGFGNDPGVSAYGVSAANSPGSLGPSTGSLGPSTGSLGPGNPGGYHAVGGSNGFGGASGFGNSGPSVGGQGNAAGGQVAGFGNVSISSANPGDYNPVGGVAHAGQFGYPTLSQIVGQLESGFGNPSQVAQNQKLGLADPVYGQYSAFQHDYGSGVDGINALASSALAHNPNMTVADFYAMYALGHPTNFATLTATHPDYAHNFNANAGVPGTTPLAAVAGFGGVDAAGVAATYGNPAAQADAQNTALQAQLDGLRGGTHGIANPGIRGGTGGGQAGPSVGHGGH